MKQWYREKILKKNKKRSIQYSFNSADGLNLKKNNKKNTSNQSGIHFADEVVLNETKELEQE